MSLHSAQLQVKPFDPPERGWFLLALVSLALGALMAIVLVAAKTPAAEQWPPLTRLFPEALVYHVNLSITFWVQACLALTVGRFSSVSDQIERLLPAVGLAGLVLLLVGAAGPAPVRFSDYIPLKQNGFFAIGMGSLWLAVGARILLRLPAMFGALRRASRADEVLIALAGLSWLLAVAVGAGIRLTTAAAADPLGPTIWAAGHLFQLSNLLLLLGVLAGSGGGTPWPRAILGAVLLAAAGGLLPLRHLPGAPDFYQEYELWMRLFSLPLIPLVLAPLALTGERMTLAVIVLVLIGAFCGAAIRGSDLRVPAHYHAMTGALNLALMGEIYRRLTGSLTDRIARLQLAAYLCGVILLVAGFAFAGWLGVGRKLVSGAEHPAGDVAQALWVVGLGGALALAAALMFVARVFWLWRQDRAGLAPIRVAGVR